MKFRTRKFKAVDKLKETSSVSSSESSSSYISVLPLAILLDIFFRLPINAVLNCKFVCKAWFNLIVSDPQFSNNYYSPFTTLLISRPSEHNIHFRYYEFCMFEFSSGIDPNTTFQTTFNPRSLQDGWSSKLRNYSLKLVGTCNGFICISICKDLFIHTVYVCNLFTNESVTMLPKHIMGHSTLYYRFGFCRSSNKFKVLRIVSKYRSFTFGTADSTEVEICTVGVDDKWRRCCFKAFVHSYFDPKWIAPYGAFHWFVSGEENTTTICTFDLKDEEIGQTLPPPGLVIDRLKMKLATLSNQLCLLDYSDFSEIVIWTLNDHKYGNPIVEKSWTKDVVFISCFPTDWVVPRYGARCESFHLVGKLRTGTYFCQLHVEDFSFLITLKTGNVVEFRLLMNLKTAVSMTFSPCFASSDKLEYASALNDRF